jgi:hypothetical protein
VARELDEQLLQSVGIRRRRLIESTLWGRSRSQLAMTDNITRFMVGVVVAAIICAGCVGWSFLQNALEQQRLQQQRQFSGSITP